MGKDDLSDFVEANLIELGLSSERTLAKYILALVRKPKQYCIEQLRDFLQQDAEPFVNKLYDFMKKQEDDKDKRGKKRPLEEPEDRKSKREYKREGSRDAKRNRDAKQKPKRNADEDFSVPISGSDSITLVGETTRPYEPENAGLESHILPFQSRARLPKRDDYLPQFHGPPGPGLGFGHPFPAGQGFNIGSNSILVCNLPPDHQQCGKIDTYFSKYGHVLEVKIIPERSSAMVTFSAHHEAERAMRSTDAILDNRFIVTKWASEPRALRSRPDPPPYVQPPSPDAPPATEGALPPPVEDAQTAEARRNEQQRAAAKVAEYRQLLETRRSKREEQQRKVRDLLKQKQEKIEQVLNKYRQQLDVMSKDPTVSAEAKKELVKKIRDLMTLLKETIRAGQPAPKQKPSPIQQKAENATELKDDAAQTAAEHPVECIVYITDYPAAWSNSEEEVKFHFMTTATEPTEIVFTPHCIMAHFRSRDDALQAIDASAECQGHMLTLSLEPPFVSEANKDSDHEDGNEDKDRSWKR
eukprot:TRINITY_DN10996_c0_g1_i1.p1 TRINITY_DN10996_c0_g1~~TRINITY_DN10996_c0_g1_i1.p1  ORF type:complete len:527 (-),score=89.58 TRINITY_DN10996_c0_g1_i1:116-1696(-)